MLSLLSRTDLLARSHRARAVPAGSAVRDVGGPDPAIGAAMALTISSVSAPFTNLSPLFRTVRFSPSSPAGRALRNERAVGDIEGLGSRPLAGRGVEQPAVSLPPPFCSARNRLASRVGSVGSKLHCHFQTI